MLGHEGGEGVAGAPSIYGHEAGRLLQVAQELHAEEAVAPAEQARPGSRRPIGLDKGVDPLRVRQIFPNDDVQDGLPRDVILPWRARMPRLRP